MLTDLHEYLTFRGDGSGVELVSWYHRQFWEAAKEWLFNRQDGDGRRAGPPRLLKKPETRKSDGGHLGLWTLFRSGPGFKSFSAVHWQTFDAQDQLDRLWESLLEGPRRSSGWNI